MWWAPSLKEEDFQKNCLETLTQEALQNRQAVIFLDETFMDFKKALESTFGWGANTLLYFAGKGCGKQLYRRLSTFYTDEQSLIQAFIELKKRENWGTFTCDLNNLEFHVKDCFEARSRRSLNGPACHFVRGVIEGFMTKVLKKRLKVMESRCVAKADEECVFVMILDLWLNIAPTHIS